jgi:rSAM/selenodomain-associated transferase 2
VTISVVIPTMNEAATVAAAVAAARRELGECEIVVVDADSTDGTAAAAAAAGARVVTAAGTLAAAMNLGASITTGDVLLFLHADTMLPVGAAGAISAALRTASAGAFRIRFDQPRPVLELLANVRSRLLKVVYGDQALFVSRAAFDRAGGFRPIPIMEDRDLAGRLRRQGGLAIVPLAVTTSARRHRSGGLMPTLARGWLIQLLYTLGVPPERLARRYPPVR